MKDISQFKNQSIVVPLDIAGEKEKGDECEIKLSGIVEDKNDDTIVFKVKDVISSKNDKSESSDDMDYQSESDEEQEESVVDEMLEDMPMVDGSDMEDGATIIIKKKNIKGSSPKKVSDAIKRKFGIK